MAGFFNEAERIEFEAAYAWATAVRAIANGKTAHIIGKGYFGGGGYSYCVDCFTPVAE